MDGNPVGNVLVIDVLRATSTIVTAIYNGCRAVVPVTSVKDAQETGQRFDRKDVLLCGERGGRKIAGFDLGNSPLEYTRERIEDKVLVFTTTNGTRALKLCDHAEVVWITSLLNLSAVKAEVLQTSGGVTIVCAGQEGKESFEDSMCAGLLVHALQKCQTFQLSENACKVQKMAQAAGGSLFAASSHAAHLETIGFGADLEYCARIDEYEIVPVYKNGIITH